MQTVIIYIFESKRGLQHFSELRKTFVQFCVSHFVPELWRIVGYLARITFH